MCPGSNSGASSCFCKSLSPQPFPLNPHPKSDGRLSCFVTECSALLGPSQLQSFLQPRDAGRGTFSCQDRKRKPGAAATLPATASEAAIAACPASTSGRTHKAKVPVLELTSSSPELAEGPQALAAVSAREGQAKPGLQSHIPSICLSKFLWPSNLKT